MTITTDHAGTEAGRTTAPTGNGWATAGVVAGLASIAGIVASGMAGAVYDETVSGDAPAIVDKMADQIPQMLVFHTATMVSAVLLLVFTPGLRRFLAARVPAGSLLPDIAAAGMALVAVAQMMGAALSTEFIFALTDPDLLVPETADFFGHWIGTVPWVWVGAGVAALAVGIAGRSFGAVPRWLVWTSLVLGVLTTLFGVSPLQYMAGMTGPLWLTAVALGLRARA
jgi:hypothetical protein